MMKIMMTIIIMAVTISIKMAPMQRREEKETEHRKSAVTKSEQVVLKFLIMLVHQLMKDVHN